MNIVAPAALTIDGVNYPVDGFSETVQRLVAIRTQWQNDLQAERLKVAKTEAAMRSLDVELTQTVTAELVAKAEEEQNAEVATDTSETEVADAPVAAAEEVKDANETEVADAPVAAAEEVKDAKAAKAVRA